VADDLLTGMTAEMFVCSAPVPAWENVRFALDAAKLGGSIVAAGQFMALLKERSAAAIEETFMEVLEGALETSDVAMVDDLHLVMEVVEAYNNRAPT